jgi:hypothetical protein
MYSVRMGPCIIVNSFDILTSDRYAIEKAIHACLFGETESPWERSRERRVQRRQVETNCLNSLFQPTRLFLLPSYCPQFPLFGSPITPIMEVDYHQRNFEMLFNYLAVVDEIKMMHAI